MGKVEGWSKKRRRQTIKPIFIVRGTIYFCLADISSLLWTKKGLIEDGLPIKESKLNFL